MTLRNLLCALAALWLVPAAGAQSLVLTGAFDGPLTGGLPKAVEIYVLEDVADLGLYGFGSANNGGGTDGAEFVFPAGVSAAAGDYITLGSEDVGFAEYFGVAPTFVAGEAANVNGDDALELFFDADGDGDFSNAVVIDTFGDINTDGTGQPWEYLDGWVYRLDGTGPDGTAFVPTNWVYSGIDANDGQTSNDTAANPFPLGTYQPMNGGDEDPTVAFSAASGTVEEGMALTADVTLSFTGDAPAEAVTVEVRLGGGSADATDVAATPRLLRFEAPMNGDTQTVTFATTDDADAEGDETATFSLVVVSGNAEVGSPGTFALTITDNDAVQPVSIAEARAAGSGALVQVTGTVSRAQGAFTYVQDDTAGLTIRQTSGAFFDAVADGTIAPGTEITVTGTLSEFNSLLQINEGALESFSVGATGDAPEAQTVTLAELAANGEAYEAELVRVEDVSFDAQGTFAASTNYDVTDPTGSLVLRVVGANDTDVDGTAIPSLADVTAIVGQFSSSNPAAGYQLQPIEASDVMATGTAPALVQIVHNAPDPAAEVVDVYVDGALALDDLAFQTATAFLALPSETDLEIAVAPGASTSAADAVFTGTYQLAEGESYQLVAQGVLDPSMFAANPDGLSTAFTLAVNAFVGDNPGTPDDASDVEVNFFHGTPDAPAVDVRTGDVAQAIIFNDVPYGDFVFDYQPLPAAATELEVTSADATVSFGTATADLSGLAGQFVTAMASGFADPAANQGGAPLSLLLVLADGTTLTAVVSTAGESEGEGAGYALFAPAPNPSTASTRVAFSLAAPGAATVAVYDALGRRVAVLADETLAADRHERQLDTARLAAGVYVVRLTTEAGVRQQTLTVVR